jgi:uncharacterized protein YktA (UPF0223 family)
LSALVVWIFSLNIKLQKADNTNKELEINANKINKFLPSVLKTIDNFIFYENLSVNDVDLLNRNGDVTKLSSIVELEKMIIFLPEINCHTCSEREIKILKDFIQPEQRARIIVISKFQNKRELKLFEINSGLKTYEIMNDNELFKDITLNKTSVVFLISPFLKGYCFLIRDKENSKLFERYYQMIQKRFSY